MPSVPFLGKQVWSEQSYLAALFKDMMYGGGGGWGASGISHQVITKTLTSAQILALFSTPVVLVADDPNYLLLPRSLFTAALNTSTVYTLNSSTRLKIRWRNTSLTEVLGVPLAGFLDQSTTKFGLYDNGPGSAAGTYSNYAIALAAEVTAGKGIEVTCDVANPTVGTGTVFMRIIYDKVPLASFSS